MKKLKLISEIHDLISTETVSKTMAEKINDFEKKLKKPLKILGRFQENLKKHFGMNTKIVFVNFIQKKNVFFKKLKKYILVIFKYKISSLKKLKLF